MNITCVTSRYLPNLRYIARLLEVDTSVVLDLTSLPHRNKDSFISRNRILDKSGTPLWLSLPIRRKGVKYVKDATIDSTNRTWVEKHIKNISFAYPNHRRLAGDFLEKLRHVLKNNNGTLIDINSQSLNLILETLNYTDLSIKYQSSLIDKHNFDHRLEISKSIGAKSYISGHVEWEIINKNDMVSRMENSGVQVFRSPDLDLDNFPIDLTVKLSCIHSICFNGIDKTRELIDSMVNLLKKNLQI